MSGGYFNYRQREIDHIADEIETLIESNDFSEQTIAEFKKAAQALRIAYIYTQRIDWLVSGDDGEDIFHHRLKLSLANLSKL